MVPLALKSHMSNSLRNSVVIGVFALVALIGLTVSYAAPYVASGDEVVYLTGALQVRDGNLPDAYMLQGYNDGPYLYPKVMSRWYESLGYYTFKSLYLAILIIATGLAAYAMFRLIGLAWVPSLLLAVVALMPRFASGQEIFGVLTFKEAIGRAGALPLFFLGTGFLIKRLKERKSLWPLFGIFGLALFLHPVTVILFAFISLIAVAAVRVSERVSLWKIFSEVVISGFTFIIAGAYFFIEVLTRLSHGVASEGVNATQYVQAIVFRNAWEFPAGVVQWYPHMAIVSAFFVGALILFYTVPALQTIRAKHVLPYAKDILVWGFTVAIGSIVFGLTIPWVNLYLMEHANAPYIFQQWSRLTKFYYLGLFIAMIPMVYALWQSYLESQWRFKTIIVALIFIVGILSSSFAFETAQFLIGYKNFEKAYIPQSLSHIPNSITPAEYYETCEALTKLGATSALLVISGDFAFRYYCKARLYVTNEEGAAYQQLRRSDVVSWYTRYLAQSNALKDGDPQKILNFASSVGANFVIFPKTAKYTAFGTSRESEVTITTRHIIVRVVK